MFRVAAAYNERGFSAANSIATMDLIKAFTENNETVAVNIQGTHDDPLFQANQIGELLDIKNIRDTLRGFDGDEKAVGSAVTPGGRQDTLFLTEVGLYRLLGISRKPLARPFQKWVARTIKEIRQMGRYELETNNNALQKAQEESQEALELERQARRSAEEEAASLKAKLASKYLPGQQLYVIRNNADSDRDLYKLGTTKDLSKRMVNYNTAFPDGGTVLHCVKCFDSFTCEKIVGRALEPYRYRSEWYMCDISIITHAMDAVVAANDGIVRSVDHLAKHDVSGKIRSIFKEIEEQENLHCESHIRARSPSPVQLVKRRLNESAAILRGWLSGPTSKVIANENDNDENDEVEEDDDNDESEEEGDNDENEDEDDNDENDENDNASESSEDTCKSARDVATWLAHYYDRTERAKDYLIKRSVYQLYRTCWDDERDGPIISQAVFNAELDAILRSGAELVAGKMTTVLYGIKRNSKQVKPRAEVMLTPWVNDHLVPSDSLDDQVVPAEAYERFNLTEPGQRNKMTQISSAAFNRRLIEHMGPMPERRMRKGVRLTRRWFKWRLV